MSTSLEIRETVDEITFRFHPFGELQKAQPAGLSIQNLGGVLYQVDDLGNATAIIGGGGSGLTGITGDVVATGPGTVNSTIQPNVVTFAKFQQIGANSILGNATGSTANVAALSPGTVRTLLGLATIATSGSASDLVGGTLPVGVFPAFTGDVTTSAGATATTIAAGAVTTAKIAANAVTLAKLATQADQTLLGNVSGGAAVPSALTQAQVLTFLGATGVSAGSYTNVNLTVTAGGVITTIANGSAPTSYTFSTGLTNTSGTVTANLSTGISGGQTAIGGTASGDGLTISSTSNGTKGKVIFGSTAGMYFDESETSASATTPALVVGTSSVTAAGGGTIAQFHRSQANGAWTLVSNGSAGGGVQIGYLAASSATSLSTYMSFTLQGTGFTTSGVLVANSALFELVASTAPMIYSLYGGGDHIFTTTTSRTERLRIANGGSITSANNPYFALSSGSKLTQANGTVWESSMTPPSQVASASAKLDAFKYDAVTATFTTAVNITNATGVNFIDVEAPTYTNSSACVVTNAATFVIKGAPVASGSLTITNPYALWVQGGPVRFDGTNGDSINGALLLNRAGDQAIEKSGGTFYLATTDSNVIAFVTNGTSRANLRQDGTYSLFNINPTVASAAGATLDAFSLNGTSTVTISGSTMIATANGFNWAVIKQPNYQASGAVTISGPAATMRIEGGPISNDASVTFSGPRYVLWLTDPSANSVCNLRLDTPLTGTGSGVIVTTNAPAGVGSLNLKYLPINVNGTITQLLCLQ